MPLSIEELQQSDNIAELLEDETLAEIGRRVIQGYQLDEDSREEWLATVNQALDIAKQTQEVKNTPWPGASNIKFPLITQAAEDYSSRTFPQLIQNDRVVKTSIVGDDSSGAKQEQAANVERYMSFQLLTESETWEDGTDKLVKILPIVGTVFRKTYYDPIEDRVLSELCVPEKIVLNYCVQSLETARRVTHILELYDNDIRERMAAGIYREVDLETLQPEPEAVGIDPDASRDILEQHTYFDLDEDGYKEPYIVTVHKLSGTVLRIVNRFDSVKKTTSGKVLRIVPHQFFTDYHFIKSPDGGFYSLGFGSLLLPLNAAINTLINQLVDAGTLNNKQGGFIGRGVRVKNGEFSFKMGEWKILDSAAGTDLAQNIFPMPTKEPSPTLLQLLQLLLQAGKELSSTTDVMQGKQPAQNVAQGTMAMLIEQGAKIFSAINKRLYRSLKKEFRKIFELNHKHLSNAQYQRVLDNPTADVKHDFDPNNYDVFPVADPALSTAGQRLVKAQALGSIPGINQYELGKYQLDALQIPPSEISKLLPEPDPNAPPPPEIQKIMAETDRFKAEAQKFLMEAKSRFDTSGLETAKVQIQAQQAEVLANESAARTMKMKEDAAVNRAKLAVAGAKADQKGLMEELNFEHDKEKTALELAIKAKEVQLKHKVDMKKVDKPPKPKGDKEE